MITSCALLQENNTKIPVEVQGESAKYEVHVTFTNRDPNAVRLLIRVG
jgi:hypothetical protein